MVKASKDIVIRKNGMAVYNPSESDILADGWVVYNEHMPTAEEVLIKAKDEKIRELVEYDESEDVNDFIIVYQGKDMHYWADKTERNELKNAVRDCISMGRDVYRLDLRDKGVSITLPCEALLQMMAALEVYAIDCYNKTTDHEYAIRALGNKEEVEAYDFKVGYPDKLRFEV